jgi:hypothetical protein
MIESDDLRQKVMHHVNSERAIKGAIAPSESDLDMINAKYALQPLTAEEVAVFPVYLANDQVDRDQERFSDATLKRFAETLPGKSFLMAHQWGPPGKARFYDAKIKREGDEQWLVGHIYLLRKYHEQLIDEVNAGTWWAVSIGFKYAIIVPVSKDGEDMNPGSEEFDHRAVAYWEFREDPEHGLESEAFEGSLVYLGAQYGAAMGHASKAFNLDHQQYLQIKADGMKIDEGYVQFDDNELDSITITSTSSNENGIVTWTTKLEGETKPGWDETGTSYRYRVREPDQFSEMRTITLQKEPVIRAVYGKLKDKDEWKIQSLIFPKDAGWTLDKAKAWVKDHPDVLKSILENWDSFTTRQLDYLELISKKGDDMDQDCKRVIPFKHYPLAPENEPWDGPKEVAAADTKDLRIMSTWFDADKPEVKESYKLPHHKADGYNTVWRGVANAMARLAQTDIPSGERRGVYNHLAKHYSEFEKEPPDFSSVDAGEYKFEDEGDANMDKCEKCEKELVEGKCPACDVEPAPEPPKDDDQTTKMLGAMENMAASIGKLAEDVAASVKALDQKIDAVGDSLKQTQGRLDDDTQRKGKAFEPDAKGFMKVPVTGPAIGALDKNVEPELDPNFKVSNRTGRIDEKAVKGFYERHGLDYIDMNEHAAGKKDPDVKQKILDNIDKLLLTAWDWDAFEGE